MLFGNPQMMGPFGGTSDILGYGTRPRGFDALMRGLSRLGFPGGAGMGYPMASIGPTAGMGPSYFPAVGAYGKGLPGAPAGLGKGMPAGLGKGAPGGMGKGVPGGMGKAMPGGMGVQDLFGVEGFGAQGAEVLAMLAALQAGAQQPGAMGMGVPGAMGMGVPGAMGMGAPGAMGMGAPAAMGMPGTMGMPGGMSTGVPGAMGMPGMMEMF